MATTRSQQSIHWSMAPGWLPIHEGLFASFLQRNLLIALYELFSVYLFPRNRERRIPHSDALSNVRSSGLLKNNMGSMVNFIDVILLTTSNFRNNVWSSFNLTFSNTIYVHHCQSLDLLCTLSDLCEFLYLYLNKLITIITMLTKNSEKYGIFLIIFFTLLTEFIKLFILFSGIFCC